jgi:hypothetical protein
MSFFVFVFINKIIIFKGLKLKYVEMVDIDDDFELVTRKKKKKIQDKNKPPFIMSITRQSDNKEKTIDKPCKVLSKIMKRHESKKAKKRKIIIKMNKLFF